MSAIRLTNGRAGFGLFLGALMLLFPNLQRTAAQNNPSLVLEEKPLRYSLPNGETTLIVQVPNAALLDRFTFINQEAVRGALNIAVANSCLSPTDPNWKQVSGDIAFAHKRHFNLSMLGVEATYVKLCFRVTKEDRIADVAF